MSKRPFSFWWKLPTLAFAVFGAFAPSVHSQDIEATITIEASKSPVIAVRGKFLKSRESTSRRNIAFLRSVAGINNIANRVSDLRLFDSSSKEIVYKKLMDGEYLASDDIVGWAYTVDLFPLKEQSAAAHVSWWAGDTGILMLADLLPLNSEGVSGKITIEKRGPGFYVGPLDPPILSTEKDSNDGMFHISDIDSAVFYLGTGWSFPLDLFPLTERHPPRVFVSGDWNFQPADLAPMVIEIRDSYKKLFGSDLATPPIIGIAKFPKPVSPGHWEAETRGNSITIVSSDMPFRTQSLQRLHEQLRHEMFHLWIPNGVNLTGNYDWFYEGFALYQSLKLAVALNRIRFEDFLDTLSRAHTIDSVQSQRLSLIEASTSRFSGSNTQVYARGMLIAFLTDVAMLQRSKGRKSVENIFREIYTKHAKPRPTADGNTAVIEALRSHSEVVPIVDRYVTGIEKIDWGANLAAAGIEDSDVGVLTNLRVVTKPTGRQKALLDKLGYNNWRNLPRSSK